MKLQDHWMTFQMKHCGKKGIGQDTESKGEDGDSVVENNRDYLPIDLVMTNKALEVRR
jgi:hypothetical protein